MHKLGKLLNVIYIILIQYTFAFTQERKEVSAPINIPGFLQLTPCISLDGNTMVFVSNRDGLWKMYESFLKEDSTWTEPKSIEAINKYVTAESVFGSTSISFSGNTLYFCANFSGIKDEVSINSLGDEDIYYSVRQGDSWGKPINIGAPINTEGHDATPSISFDERTIYFVRTNEKAETDGYLCKKIYYSQKDTSGMWQVPVPLPVNINLDCEQSPRICSDGRTLMFSSVRASGMGNADLYYSKMIAKNVWTDPISMKFANTPNTEQYVSIVAVGDVIYYSMKGTLPKPFGNIYKIYLPQEYRPFKTVVVQGKIFDFYTKLPLDATIRISDLNTTEVLYEVKNNIVDGKYTLVLTEGKDYTIDIFKDDKYSHNVFQYKLKQLQNCELVKTDVPLFPKINLYLNVFDSENFEPLTSDIEVKEQLTNVSYPCKVNKLTLGRNVFDLQIGKKYEITASSSDHNSRSFKIDLTSLILFDNIYRTVILDPEKVEVVIDLLDGISNSSIENEFYAVNLQGNETVKAVKQSDGKYTLQLRQGAQYSVNISPKGYSFYNTTIDLKKRDKSKKIEVKLQPLVKSTLLTLSDINFEFNSAELNVDSYEELDRTVKLLMNNSGVKVEISAHTDDKGADAYNMNLSYKRAKSVVDYLIDKKIPENQIIPKGYGKTLPKVPNNSDENRKINRRVEIKVL